MFKKIPNSPRPGRLAFAALAASLLLSACAMTPASDDERVVERAQARWDAIIAGDVETAYEFFSPGYRSTHSLIDFAVGERVRRVKRTSAEYLEHQCEETRCLVTFKLGFIVHKPVPGMIDYSSSSKVEDTWIKTNGEWWYLPKK
jgi:hypothetical protein